MTNEQSDNGATTSASDEQARCRRVRSRRARFTVGAAVLLLTGAVLGGAATIAAGASAHGRFGNNAEAGEGGDRMARHFQRKLERVLAEVDATDAQGEQAQDIVDAFVTDFAPLREEHREQRKAVLEAMLAEELDVTRIETLRSSVVETADRMSRELTESMTALAQVFEPEQRAEIAELVEKFAGRHGRRHRR